ncbi:MAG: site-2 protease family protein [Clostridia bacterium]|nr:site-2 protease family protein [Clostridia bacterium]
METFFTMRLVIYSLGMLITGEVGISDMSGPVGASTVIGQAASAGALSLFNIFAMLSVNVGLFNLIPFPALDGGRIFFLLIEMIRRKPIPPEKEGMVHFIGLILLLILMVFVTSSDIYKLFLPKG